MADGTTLNAQSGSPGDTIATDDLTTMNGGAISGVKVQRVKAGFGSDGDLRDVDTSNGLPVAQQGAWSVSVSNFGQLDIRPLTSSDQVTTVPSGTQTVSGTVTANAGSGTFAISAASLPLPTSAATDASVTGLQVSQGSTTSGQKGSLTLGAVTTSAPSYTTAQSSPLSLTTAGALRVDASATTQPVSGTVAATQSGTWTVQPGNTANTTPWLVKLHDGTNAPAVKLSSAGASGSDYGIVVTFGSAAQAQVVGTVAAGSAIGSSAPVMMGGSDGTNVRRIKVDTSGNQIAIVSDGTSNAAVKAASTAPAASDPALVVTQSPNGTSRTASLTQVTSSGTVSAGAQSVTFANVGTANATVSGGTLAPNQTVSFSVNYPDTIGAITYTASATAILNIAKVV